MFFELFRLRSLRSAGLASVRASIVADHSRRIRRGTSTQALQALSLTSAFVWCLMDASPARAAPCSAQAYGYLCSGTTTRPVDLRTAGGTVVLDDSFTANVNGGYDIWVTATNGVTIDQAAGSVLNSTGSLSNYPLLYGMLITNGLDSPASASTGNGIKISALGTITGVASAIAAINSSVGEINITSGANAITGKSETGIFATAYNYGNAINITTGTGQVSGGRAGIYAETQNASAITIDTRAGLVTGTAVTTDSVTSGQGIGVVRDVAGDVTIRTGNVTGVSFGVTTQNFASGNVLIDTTGGVVSTSSPRSQGIRVSQGMTTAGGSGSVTINSGDVTSGTGIYAENLDKTAKVNFNVDTTKGTVTGNANDAQLEVGRGVWVVQRGSGDIAITTATVNGVRNGIETSSIGAGAITINSASGQVTATGLNSAGISAAKDNASSVNNISITTAGVSGRGYGINTALLHGGGTIAIDTTKGAVAATDVFSQGIRVVLSALGPTGSSTVNIKTGAVTGGTGIYAQNADSTATVNFNLDTSAGTVSANSSNLSGRGIWVNQAGQGSIDITTADVSGVLAGIDIDSAGGPITIDSTQGTVSSSGADSAAIDLDRLSGSGDMTITTADVQGAGWGIYANLAAGTGNLTVDTSKGKVSGTQQQGIFLFTNSAAGKVDLTTADVSGNSQAISVNHNGTEALTLTSKGLVAASASAATSEAIRVVSTGANATVKIEQTSQVTAAKYGVTVFAAGRLATVQNYGAIKVDNGAGVFVSDTNPFDSSASPPTYATHSLIENWGTIAATSGYAVQSGSGIDVVNQWAGSLKGDVSLGANDDRFNGLGGQFNGNLLMGDGTDQAIITSAMTLVPPALMDGGTGKDELILQGQKLSGGTWALTPAGATTPGNGTNLARWEVIELNGASALSLTNNLFAADNLGLLKVDAGAILDASTVTSGLVTIFGDVSNKGTITLNDGQARTDLTITGNYDDPEGMIALDTVLEGDTSATDKVIIMGNTTGQTALLITQVGGKGAQTDHGIKVIEVNGTSDSSAFYLANGAALNSGAYNYRLTYYGAANPSDQSWYLTSKVNALGAGYEAASGLALNDLFTLMPTLEQRVGQRQWLARNNMSGLPFSTGLWLRNISDYERSTPRHSDAATQQKSWRFGMQGGFDVVSNQNAYGTLVLGLTGQYLSSHSSVRNDEGRGHIHSDYYGGGLTASWYGAQGFYADAQAQINHIRQRYSTDSAGSLKKHQGRTGYALSHEMGYRFDLNETMRLVPQAQFIWGDVDRVSFTDKSGNDVKLHHSNGGQGRLGLAYEYEYRAATLAHDFGDYRKAYAIGNLLHNFKGHSRADVSGIGLAESNDRSWAEIGLGASLGRSKAQAIFMEANYRTKLSGHGAGHGIGATAGFRYSW